MAMAHRRIDVATCGPNTEPAAASCAVREIKAAFGDSQALEVQRLTLNPTLLSGISLR